MTVGMSALGGDRKKLPGSLVDTGKSSESFDFLLTAHKICSNLRKSLSKQDD